MPRKPKKPQAAEELHAKALLWHEPINTDAPPRPDSIEPPENLDELANYAGAIVEGETEDGKTVYTVDPMTPEELRRTFAQLNPVQAQALAEMLQQSAQAAAAAKQAQAAAEATVQLAAQIIKQAEPHKPEPDTETMYLGPEFEPKQHRENNTVTVSPLAKSITKHGNKEPYTLQGRNPTERVTITLKNDDLPVGVTLSFEDCRILDAIGMLWEEGWRDFTAQMVYNKVWANDPKTPVPRNDDGEDVIDHYNERIEHFSSTRFELVDEGYFLRHGLKPKRVDTLVSVWGKDEIRNGNSLFIWHFKDCKNGPPIYVFSKAVNQTIEVPRILLHPQGRRSKNKLLAAYYMAIRAHQTANTQPSGEDVLLLETAYKEIYGEEPENTRVGRQKFKRFLSACLVPVLEHFKQHGELEEYHAEMSRSGSASIKYTIPKNRIKYTPPEEIEGGKGKKQ